MTRRSDFFGWFVPLAIAIVSLMLSGWVEYSHNDKDLSNRISVVETKQADQHEDLQDIKQTVQKIYDKVANW